MTTKWGGRKAQAWSRAVIAAGGGRCALQLHGCTQVATTGDHIIPRSVDPTREYDVSNGRPACLHCNVSRMTTPLEPVIVDPLGILTPDIPWLPTVDLP